MFYVGSRICKSFSGEVHQGTVTKFIPDEDNLLWSISYDDGDKEDMNYKELSDVYYENSASSADFTLMRQERRASKARHIILGLIKGQLNSTLIH